MRKTITVITCDICGEETYRSYGSISYKYDRTTLNGRDSIHDKEYEDICESCSEKFRQKMRDLEIEREMEMRDENE